MLCCTKNGWEEIKGTLLFLGDSITDGGSYVALTETYLRLYAPQAALTIRNLGVCSETLSGLSEPSHPFPRPCLFGRLDRALEAVQPDWVVACYGINDGIYYPFSEEHFQAFQKGCRALVEKVHAAGAKAVIVTPAPFDPVSFTAKGAKLAEAGQAEYSYIQPYKDYDGVMERYSNWILEELAQEADLVIDIYHPLREDRAQRYKSHPRRTTGDGIHPNLHGNWVMAGVLLQELFGIAPAQFEQTMRRDHFRFYRQMFRRHMLLHQSDKETVGHDHTAKSPYLSGQELEAALKKKDETIDRYLRRHPKLLQKKDRWMGYHRQNFHFEGCEALVVSPRKAAPGHPWVWRTEFFGAFATADLAMVKKGWHIAYLSIPDQFGCPTAVAQMARFQTFLRDKFALAEKAALFGFSRGGLYALHYAACYPEKVAALYLDAPVVDIASWPGGQGTGEGSPVDWARCLRAFGLTAQTAHHYNDFLDTAIQAVTSARLPLLLVAGGKDKVVPYDENGVKLTAAWNASGAPFRLILKPEIGHHPHSLKNPGEIVAFLLEHTNYK